MELGQFLNPKGASLEDREFSGRSRFRGWCWFRSASKFARRGYLDWSCQRRYHCSFANLGKKGVDINSYLYAHIFATGSCGEEVTVVCAKKYIYVFKNEYHKYQNKWLSLIAIWISYISKYTRQSAIGLNLTLPIFHLLAAVFKFYTKVFCINQWIFSFVHNDFRSPRVYPCDDRWSSLPSFLFHLMSCRQVLFFCKQVSQVLSNYHFFIRIINTSHFV